jgi:hypothetical protein
MQVIIIISIFLILLTVIIYKINDKFEKKEFLFLVAITIFISTIVIFYEKYQNNYLPNMFKAKYENERKIAIKSLDYELLNNKVVNSKDKFIYKFIYTIEKDGDEFLCYVNDIEINRVKNEFVFVNFDRQKEECFKK